jgi:outer membrane receptor protein involved in Fe transport
LIVRSADMEIELDWRFAPGWRTTWKGRIEGLRADLRRLQPFNVPQQRQNEAWNAAMQWGVVRDFSTGPARHQLLLGFDLDRARTVQNGINADVSIGDSGVTIDTLEFKQAVLLQDQVSLGGLRLRASVQRSRTPLFEETGLVTSNTGPHLATNWDLGALYRVTPWASVYAGTQYAVETDHRQGGALLDDGSTPPPTALRQVQAGAKFQLFERRMDLGVEAFRLRQIDKLYTFAAALPGRFVDGAELDLSGRPRPGLDLSFGLALARGTDFVVDANGASGFEVPAVGLSRGSMHLLGSYQLPQALLNQSRLVVGYRA